MPVERQKMSNNQGSFEGWNIYNLRSLDEGSLIAIFGVLAPHSS
jgi:hypothetical protein